MKKFILVTVMISLIFLPLTLFGQGVKGKPIGMAVPPLKKSGEYNQSGIEKVRIQYQQFAQNLAQQVPVSIGRNPRIPMVGTPGGYGTRNGLSFTMSNYGFGVNGYFSQRIKRDLFVFAEINYYVMDLSNAGWLLSGNAFGIQNNSNNNNSNNNNENYSMTTAYGGFTRAFYQQGRFKRFYPYIGAGIGLASIKNGMQNLNYTYGQNSNITLITESALAKVGTEIYLSNRLFLSTDLQYQYITFSKPVNNRKDYSGFVFNFGCGFGFGKMLYR